MALWVVGQSPGDDFTSLHTAVNDGSVVDGDTIHVRDDAVLSETVTQYTRKNMIIDAHPDNASGKFEMMGSATGTALTMNAANGNNTLRNAKIHNYQNGVDWRGTLEDCEIYDMADRGTNSLYGAMRRCFIHDTGEYGHLGGANIENCLFVRCGAWASCRNDGAGTYYCRNTIIIGTLAGHKGLQMGTSGTVSNVYVEGSGTIGIETGLDFLVRNCHVHGTWSTAAYSVAGGANFKMACVETTDAGDAAVFKDAASDDYRIGANSPLIGKGHWTGLTTDYDGKPYGAAIPNQGQASFNGTSSYIQIAGSPPATVGSDYSVFYWAKAGASGGDNVMSRYRSDDTTLAIRLSDWAGKMAVASNGSEVAVDPSHWRDVNGWFFFGWTVDYASRAVTLYRNGIQVDQTTFGANWRPPNAGDVIRWGQDPLDTPNPGWYEMTLAQVTYWGVKLSQAEIDELHKGNAPITLTKHSKFTDLVSAYEFATDASDSIGSYDGSPTDVTFQTLEVFGGVDIGAFAAPVPTTVVSLTSPSAGVLRVTYSKEMQDVPSLVKIENYKVVPIDGGRAVGIASATRFNATNVDLVVVGLLPGLSYRVEVSDA